MKARKDKGSILHTTCHTLKQVKENATNNLAPLFKTALNALSDGVVHFPHCVAPFKTLLLIGCEFSTANQELIDQWQRREKNRAPHLKEH